MNYQNVKAIIDANIRANGRELITGPVLNGVLTTIIDGLGIDPADFQNSETDKLQIANRVNGSNTTGMGYKILRSNKTFASQVTDANTIYEIRDTFDLNGNDFTLPSGCILRFNGGKVYGANITGGKMPTPDVYTPEMFGAGLTADDTQAIQNAVNICYKVRMDGNYNVKSIPGYETPSLVAGRAYVNPCIIVPSNTDIEINGVVSLTTSNLTEYALFSLYYWREEYFTKNVRIHGQGKLVGDRDTNTSTTGEHGQGIAIGGYVENIEVSGIEFEKMWGDGIIIRTLQDKRRNINVDGVYIHNCRRQGISITQGDGIVVQNFRIENISGTAPQSPIDIENETGEDYGIGDIVIRNGFIRNCANPLVCNATANLARSIIVENVDTDDIIQAHANTFVFNCVGYKLEMDKNSVAIGCKFGGLALINSSTTMRSVVKDSIFEGLTGTGINTEISDCDFRIHYYDSDGNYERIRCLYYTNLSATDVNMNRCSVITDEFASASIPRFLAMFGVKVQDSFVKVPTPRNLAVVMDGCHVEFFRSISNGYLNKNTSYKDCVITFAADVSSQKLYDLAVTGVGDINVFDCIIYSAISNPRASINGTDNNNIHDYGTIYKKKDGSFAYPLAGTTAVRTAMSLVTEQKGFVYFDTNLSKSVVWSGTAWVNMDGSALA